MKFIFYLITLCISFNAHHSFTQSIGLDSETRAFLFHVVRKSPTLNANLGHAFEYNGPSIEYTNGGINYDSIESVIINEPEKLVIRHEIIKNSPKGLIAEIANKTAIWSLNKGLNEIQNKINGSRYQMVEEYLITFHEIVGNRIKRHKSYAKLFEPAMSPLFNPGISFFDRDQLLKIMGYQNVYFRKEILESQNKAILHIVESYAKILFETLGGSYLIFDNILMAAGDGSYTSGLLDEKEKDENGNWNKGLPKAVGLFPYQMEIKEGEIHPLRISTSVLQNNPNLELTNLHFDVWGYNSNKQTTVIIQRNNKTYRFFGSFKTKFLSPDSSFSDGITIQKIINDISDQEYLNLKERLQKIEEEIQMIQRNIEEIAIKISMTSSEQKRSRRKINRQNNKLKDFKIQQKELKGILDELFLEKKEIEIPYFKIKRKIDFYKDNLGDNLIDFSEKNGLYIFDDSTIFNLETQELFFQKSSSETPIIIRLIAIPDNETSEEADEVMLHVSRVDYDPHQFPDISIDFKDVFHSDSYGLEKTLVIKKTDSIELASVFKTMKNIRPLNFDLQGNGIGKWADGQLVKDTNENKLLVYPGQSDREKTMNKNSFAFSSLRRTSVSIKFDYQLHISIHSFTDPVLSNFKPIKQWQLKGIEKKLFSKNDLLSVYRTLTVLAEIKNQILQIAKSNLSKELFVQFKNQIEIDLNNSYIVLGKLKYQIIDF